MNDYMNVSDYIVLWTLQSRHINSRIINLKVRSESPETEPKFCLCYTHFSTMEKSIWILPPSSPEKNEIRAQEF